MATDGARSVHEAEAAEKLRREWLRRWQALPNLLRANDTQRLDVGLREARRTY